VFPISTERLLVRQFLTSDASAFHAWRNDAEVARYTLWDYPYSLARAETFCRGQAAYGAFPIGNWCQVFIEELGTGSAVGDIGLGLDTDGDGALTLGYSISRAHWGKGYATEAVGAIMRPVAQAVGANTIKAEIDARNPASGKVLAKLGFKSGPVHKKRTFVKGEWCDEIDYILELT